jgi:exosome complex component RRP41
MKKKDIKLIKNGKRIDGRSVKRLRDIKMEIGVVPRASGSAKVSFGNTMAMVSVHGPRTLFPRHLQEYEIGILRCRYNMAPFSVEERKSPGPSRRGTEISKVTRLALEPAIFLQEFPKATIDTFIEIIEADGSTRVTGINACSLALASAGVPMYDLVTACSVGKIDNTLVVDINGEEDNNSEADVAFAMLPSKDEVTLLQMDGILTKEELVELLKLAKNSCKKIYELQKETLRKKYESV